MNNPWFLLATMLTAIGTPSDAGFSRAINNAIFHPAAGKTATDVIHVTNFDDGGGEESSTAYIRDRTSGEVLAVQSLRDKGVSKLVWIVPKIVGGTMVEYSGGVKPKNVRDEEGVQLFESDKGIEIKVRGKPFTTYRTNAGPKPILWPILGPTGKPITRAYPMDKSVKGESKDHIHHRSLWFTHGTLNGQNFWAETPFAGKTVQEKIIRKSNGPVFGELVTKVNWIGGDGKKVCEDERTIRVYNILDSRVFDFEIRIKATEGPLKFGDDKEGMFALRVAETLNVKQPKGKVGGTIVNSVGDKNNATWGKRADWCDYSGPVDGKTIGIAIFDHPENFRHPTYWHVRDYGLFGANPFGISYFTGDKKQNSSHEVPAGGELTFRYRVYIHNCDAVAANVADKYLEYSLSAKKPDSSKK